MTTATVVGDVEMRIAKVVGLSAADDELFDDVVLEELAGDRHLAIEIGHAEAFSLAARLGGITWPRPVPTSSSPGWCKPLAGGSGKYGSIGWWRNPTSPPWRLKAHPACSRSTPGPAMRSTWRRWSRPRSSPRPGCCERRRPDAQVIPHDGAPASGAGSSTDDRRHGGDVGHAASEDQWLAEWDT